MKEYTSKNIINVAIVGHASCGKTCLSESISMVVGNINKSGSIQNGTTISDYRKQEIDIQHSISMSMLNLEFLDKKINLIDTPGYLDFVGEMKSALRVVDNAAIVLNASEGIEVGTELAWEFSEEYNNSKYFIINMCNKDLSKFEEIVEKLKERFGRNVFPVMFPINEGDGFNKIGDVLKKEVLEFDASGNFSAKPADDMSDKLSSSYNELIEMVAESDESLLELFFEKGELSEEELRGGLNRAIKEGLIPVFCSAGENNIGTKRIVEFISKYGTSAFEKNNEISVKDSSGEDTKIKSSDSEMSALVFKTLSEEHVGELSFFRVYSGSLKSGDDISNVTRNLNEKSRQLYFMNGKNRKDAGSIIAGDIGAALKLKGTHSGDTLSSPKRKIVLNPISFPTHNVNYSIIPESRGEEDKMALGLSTCHEEDPTFVYGFDTETKETIINGQGELHIELILNKIKDRFGVGLIKSKPKVPFRETITAKSEAKYRHKKQSGGAGQFAEVWLRINPVERGAGIDFTNSLVGQNVDRGFVPSVEKGIVAMCEDGIVAGCKVVDIKIDFYDGKMHPVDSNDMAFQIAGKHAFSDAFKNARPIILEPIFKIKVKVPEDAMGDVMGDISQRRGKVSGMGSEGSFQVINAEVPLANLHDYATSLKSISSGRAMFSKKFSHYEDMPHIEAEKIKKEYDEARASGE